MTPGENDWLINLVKARHQGLNLTFEQAKQIYQFEQDRDSYSEKYYFSAWEEWDYELSTFRQILTADQLKTYKENNEESIKRYEQSLIDQDHRNTNEIEYVWQMLSYYENEFLPELFKDPFVLTYPILWARAKIEFLKAEYRIFLNERKKSILAEHFRNNRTFKPNELQVALLRHKILYLWPAYGFFKFSADDATKAVINYVKTKIKFPDKTEELLMKKLVELKAFNEANFKKYHEESRGWHVVIGHSTEEEEKEERIMSLLLLDKEKYGC